MGDRPTEEWRRSLGLARQALEWISRVSFRLSWMMTRSLRKDDNQQDDHEEHRHRCDWPAHRQATFVQRLVEEVAHRCAERSRQNERGPEQPDTADTGGEVESG